MSTVGTWPAAQGGWRDALGRVGLVGKGVLFAVIGLLAVQLAAGERGARASEVGAIEWLGQQPFGRLLLIALTISLVALAAWRLLEAVVGDPVEGDSGLDRLRYAAKGVAYALLAVGALTVTVDNWNTGPTGGTGGSGGDAASRETTAAVLGWPGGRWLVAATGLAVIAVCAYVVKAHVVDQRYLERMQVRRGSWIAGFGRFGYAARAVAYAIIGWFLVQAGLTFDAEEAQGLSGALQELSQEAWGRLVLWVVAAGLLAFGLFTLAEAKYRRAA